MIEDDESLRKLFVLICKKREYEVLAVEGSDEALEALSAQSFDVLLVDMKLINETGVDALEKIRSAGYTMPAVISSGAVNLPDAQTMQRLYVIGANDKSYNNDKLFELLDRSLTL